MERENIQTANDISQIIADIPSNVIRTGVGSIPNQISPEVSAFYVGAVIAATTTAANPLAQLDSDLLGTKSPRLERLSRSLVETAQAAKFKPLTTATTPTQTPRATTITTPTGTVIRPMEAIR